MSLADTLSIITPTEREIVITRTFDAPRQRVFDAWTKPELLRRWFGPRGHVLVVCEVDLRVGGTWRYVLRGPGGSEMLLHGVFREIVAPVRLVSTEHNVDCDAAEGAETLTTTTFVEHAGRTTMTGQISYPSADIRDAVLRSGMRRGVGEAYDRLAEVLAATGGPAA